MADYKPNCTGCNVEGCFVITYDQPVIEKCPCRACLVKSMCLDTCDERMIYYSMIIEEESKGYEY